MALVFVVSQSLRVWEAESHKDIGFELIKSVYVIKPLNGRKARNIHQNIYLQQQQQRRRYNFIRRSSLRWYVNDLLCGCQIKQQVFQVTRKLFCKTKTKLKQSTDVERTTSSIVLTWLIIQAGPFAELMSRQLWANWPIYKGSKAGAGPAALLTCHELWQIFDFIQNCKNMEPSPSDPTCRMANSKLNITAGLNYIIIKF